MQSRAERQSKRRSQRQAYREQAYIRTRAQPSFFLLFCMSSSQAPNSSLASKMMSHVDHGGTIGMLCRLPGPAQSELPPGGSYVPDSGWAPHRKWGPPSTLSHASARFPCPALLAFDVVPVQVAENGSRTAPSPFALVGHYRGEETTRRKAIVASWNSLLPQCVCSYALSSLATDPESPHAPP